MSSYAHVPPADQMRAAISILGSAAADRHWGNGDVVRVLPAGLLLGADPRPVDAAAVYQAARGLVGALVDDLVRSTGRDLDDVIAPWLLALELREAFAGMEDVGMEDVGMDDVGMDDVGMEDVGMEDVDDVA